MLASDHSAPVTSDEIERGVEIEDFHIDSISGTVSFPRLVPQNLPTTAKQCKQSIEHTPFVLDECLERYVLLRAHKWQLMEGPNTCSPRTWPRLCAEHFFTRRSNPVITWFSRERMR